MRELDLDRRARESFRTVLAHPDPPVTFTDKMRYKMRHDRRALLPALADKVAARDYVEAKVGPHVLTKLYLVTGDAATIRQDALPREFVLKASHGCGGCAVVGDHVPSDKSLPRPPAGWVRVEVAPDSVDWSRLRALCREWLRLRYLPWLEWAYRNVPSRILAEELLVQDGRVARDYKCFVFHGRVRAIQVIFDRFGDHSSNWYTPEWRALPVRTQVAHGPGIEQPTALGEMIRIAEALGQETDFVRVDLYALEDRIVVGELTNYSGGGFDPFTPASFDLELGSWWTPPEEYR